MATSQNPIQSRSGGKRDEFATVKLSGLRIGAVLRAPVYEDRADFKQLLLMAAGTTLTDRLLSRLQRRGVARVRVHQSEVERIIAGGPGAPLGRGNDAQQAIRRAESTTERFSNSRWSCSPDSFLHKVVTHGTTPYNKISRSKAVHCFQASVVKVETVFDGLAHGEINDAGVMAAVSCESLLRIADDLDLFVALGITPATDKYPCKHSLQSAMLAMSIGTILGLKSDELIELGIGCLVHDAGMLDVRSELVAAARTLNRIEFLEITKHPVRTFDRLRDVKNISNGSRLVAYQMHERLDGSGYPRRRTANQIHPLAKIAAVADVFVACVSPRPHRPGMLPYHTMEHLIRSARNGEFDQSVVRALLHTVSLFPIGSCVEINDGSFGKVVRANRDAYTRPVVELWTPNSAILPATLVDINAERDLRVVRAVVDLSSESTKRDSAQPADNGVRTVNRQ